MTIDKGTFRALSNLTAGCDGVPMNRSVLVKYWFQLLETHVNATGELIGESTVVDGRVLLTAIGSFRLHCMDIRDRAESAILLQIDPYEWDEQYKFILNYVDATGI